MADAAKSTEDGAEIDDKVPNRDTTEDGENVDAGDAKETSETKNDEVKVNNNDDNEKVEKIAEIDSAPGTSKDNTKENGECSRKKNLIIIAREGLELLKMIIDKYLSIIILISSSPSRAIHTYGRAGCKLDQARCEKLVEARRLLGEAAMKSDNHQVAVGSSSCKKPTP